MNLQTVLAIVIVVVLVAVFFISYVWNKKTPIPENCKDLFEEGQCSSCKQYDCALNKVNEIKKEELKK